MSDKQYIIWLSGKDYLLVIIKTRKGIIEMYVIKYMTIIDNTDFEVARFDSGHDYSHMDILKPDGAKERVAYFPGIRKEDAINFAIENFKLNFEVYYERFKKWLKK
jgi:hypothetical protein